MSKMRSERVTLAAIVTLAEAAKRKVRELERTGDFAFATEIVIDLAEIASEARALGMQVESGVHINPPLMLYGNPPVKVRRKRSRGTLAGGMVRLEYQGRMSDEVHAVLYTHVDDGKDYRHDFDPGVDMDAAVLGGRRVVILSRPDGKPVWEDY